ncbi:iq and hect domain protein [Lasallia pustulata]|uniref:HECT-type E3 ubiquitin transferase n=1 Tax=Lasallia pustulata TaxID=136370 RepID=A0A1W5D472_9LECA|nr:iq and hect domain protein [Lasallia pustulata]
MSDLGGDDERDDILALLVELSVMIPEKLARYSQNYYATLGALTARPQSKHSRSRYDQNLLESAVLGLLRSRTSATVSAYAGFASEYLTVPDLPSHLGNLDPIAEGVDYKILANALASITSSSTEDDITRYKSHEQLLWLLAYFIFFRGRQHGPTDTVVDAPDAEYVSVISRLLSYLADEIGARIDLPGNSQGSLNGISSPAQHMDLQLPDFVRSELLSLVNQQNISSLITHSELISPSKGRESQGPDEASAVASYALMLLAVFPRRRDDIRMWLLLGSSSSRKISDGSLENSVPAIKYFWRSASSSRVYELIRQEPGAALSLLRTDTVDAGSRRTPSRLEHGSKDREWRIVLLFLELYTLALRLMDDEEFFAGGTSASAEKPSWTRASALTLGQVKDLTVFLKNLAFTMYWNAAELSGPGNLETKPGIANYFSPSSDLLLGSQANEPSSDADMVSIAGVSGMTVNYIKGMVTGLLRMIYERDSRRNFLPKGHWLMTGRFEMEGFIPAVVAEEESRHQVQEADEEDVNDVEVGAGDSGGDASALIGTHRTQQLRYLERLRLQQRKASRRKYLEALTPRLEILQNMPFFIPFATRVQIFREFVTLDQTRRRNGHVDADQWRFSVIHNAPRMIPDMRRSGEDIIRAHHARVRREHVFEDAFEHYYKLGDGLKEPIQITFVDKFDTVEAGIDGGGVTKEFLTSVTSEAFSPMAGLNLFAENDQHLLYPNPAAVEERKDLLRQAGLKEGSSEWNEPIRDLLQRYEFLGRVVGKCLYEGILVDIHFAGFFLLKWALTGGSGAAPKESGYRANLNDLRDLDEGLYQGLLQLKNHPGNVEDFSLNFTVTDTVSSSAYDSQPGHQPNQRTVTRELCPNGSNVAVTNQNRLSYISYIAIHRLQNQPRLQTSAFLRGLGQIIQPSWLSMFNQSELQTLLGGDSSEIDVDDLRANTLYGGVYVIGDDGLEHSSVQLFWQVMRSLSDADRRKVLKFVTSTPRAPLLGFAQLNPRFSIRDAGDDQTRLPSTSTCVNLLKLPRYSEAETLREKLLYAVNSGAGFDLS